MKLDWKGTLESLRTALIVAGMLAATAAWAWRQLPFASIDDLKSVTDELIEVKVGLSQHEMALLRMEQRDWERVIRDATALPDGELKNAMLEHAREQLREIEDDMADANARTSRSEP